MGRIDTCSEEITIPKAFLKSQSVAEEKHCICEGWVTAVCVQEK